MGNCLRLLTFGRGAFLSAFAEDHGRKPVDECHGGPSEARRAKEGASADSAEEMKDTMGVNPWRFHKFFVCKVKE